MIYIYSKWDIKKFVKLSSYAVLLEYSIKSVLGLLIISFSDTGSFKFLLQYVVQSFTEDEVSTKMMFSLFPKIYNLSNFRSSEFVNVYSFRYIIKKLTLIINLLIIIFFRNIISFFILINIEAVRRYGNRVAV